MRKVIGLIPLWDDERESYWMLPGYMKLIEQCGGLPMMLPMTDDEKMLDQALGLCDGLLLTGGHDVSPTLYGQEPLAVCGKPCVMRDRMESYLLRLVLEKDMPVLGICRGIQLMNVCLGGTLYQDIPSQHPSDVNHHMTPPYDRTVHSVEIQAGTILAGILGVGKYEVNSYHHQAVCRLSPYVIPSAVSEDGLVEAIEIKEKRFALGVQWHPEFIQDDGAMKLVRARIDFYVECYDIYGEEILSYGLNKRKGCALDEIELKPGETSDKNRYWTLYGYSMVKKVGIIVSRYHTKSGKTVEIPEALWIGRYFTFD